MLLPLVGAMITLGHLGDGRVNGALLPLVGAMITMSVSSVVESA